MRFILKSSERRMLFDTSQHTPVARALRKHRNPLAFVEQVSRQTRHSEDGGWKRLARRPRGWGLTAMNDRPKERKYGNPQDARHAALESKQLVPPLFVWVSAGS